jgi:ubiquinone/menaquinone biosynthesis C-methylase UbiE
LDEFDSYTENFGKQWRDYRDIQIDSINNFEISKNYLDKMLFNDFDFIKNKEILEIGGGAGRFTEYFAKYSKKCVSVDFSSSVFHNISKGKENTTIVKADFNKLLANRKFDIVFCRGVLQHTPNPYSSILKLHSFIKKDGCVFFDIYKMPKIGYFHPKYFFWRPIIKTFIKYENFEKFLKKNIDILLLIKRKIKNLLFNSKFISDSIIPIWDYKNQISLPDKMLRNWAIMDTLDGLYAKYDFPKTNKQVINFLKKNNLKIINNNVETNIFQSKLNDDS